MTVAAIIILLALTCLTLFIFAACKVAGDYDERHGPIPIKSCEGCVHYLGGGSCRIHMERECADDDFQLWEAESHEVE